MSRPAPGAPRLGVLLMTYGSPAGPDDMPRYLTAVRGGREPSDETVAEFRRRYELIGGSPLVPITRAQAAAVEEELRRRGVEARAAAGMRFSAPTIAEGVAALAGAGCGAVVGVVMSPQHSELLMAGYRRALDDAATALGDGAPSLHLAGAWYRNEGFLGAVAGRIRQALQESRAGDGGQMAVLLTAHSLPKRVADREPTYLDQLRDTAERVAALCALPDDGWTFCWQSAGHEPGEWMKPDFADVLPGLRERGFRRVLVAPIQFLADHLEILYDIDIGARQQATAAGLEFSRIESLNVMPQFIRALATIAVEAGLAPARR